MFTIPDDISEKLIEFYKEHPCYRLVDLKQYRDIMRQHVGVYLLFYHGNNPFYECIADINKEDCRLPIYVGKAVESGKRKGTSVKNTQSLYGRVNEHKRSIEHCQEQGGLSVNDFSFKVIAMHSNLVTWGEATMIRHFKPAWNSIIEGFGIHTPGVGRFEQARSVWDCLHPGRPFAEKMKKLASFDKDGKKAKISESCKQFLEQYK